MRGRGAGVLISNSNLGHCCRGNALLESGTGVLQDFAGDRYRAKNRQKINGNNSLISFI